MTPLFSILHPTIRLPDGWMGAYKTWLGNCDDWSRVEYMLAVDGLSAAGELWRRSDTLEYRIAANLRRRCYVDAINAAARASTGQILVVAADDWFPTPHWDTEILKHIPDPTIERVLWIESEHPHIMTHAVMTRAYYERPGRGGCGGNLFHPAYSSYGCDDDLTAYAQRDGVVVRPGMRFEHRHWTLGTAPMDAAYGHIAQMGGDKDEIFARRQKENFR